jgi:hypothetical protein
MKLIKTQTKYTYEIESNYKTGDEVIFTDRCGLEGGEGLIIGIAAFENSIEYVIRYSLKVRGGHGSCVLFEVPGGQTGIFTEEQIRLK